MLFQRSDKEMNRKYISSLPRSSRSIPPVDMCRIFGKASAGTSLKGSLTVECAGLLPWFLLAMATIIGFMELYQIQTQQLLSLCERAKQAGMYAYIAEDGGKSAEITLPAMKIYESPIGVLPLPKVWLKNIVTVHAWVGYQGEGRQQPAEASEEMVYITASGTVYHLDTSCRHLDLTIRQTTWERSKKLRNRYGEKYYPCELCSGSSDGGVGLVYLTDTGNRCHNNASCSGLKRTVRLVKKSEVPNLSQCKNCKAHS